MQLQYSMTHKVQACDVDRFGRCKSAVLLYLAQEAATGHCDLLRLDWDTMAGKGLFWAVIRTHAQVERLPVLGEEITVKTWPMPTTRTAFPRAVEILDKEGNTLVQVVSLWVLMDRATRAMVLPGKSGVDVPGLLCGNELSGPGSILPVQRECQDSRRVVFSELDRNGYMNNTRYMDWVNDLLPSIFHKEHSVAEFTVCYLAEALENDTIDLAYSMDETGIFQVDGYRQQTDDRSKKTRIFSVKTRFK